MKNKPETVDITTTRDALQNYLDSPTQMKSEIVHCGGYLKYWENVKGSNRDRGTIALANMALDLLSAPGKLHFIYKNNL